MSTQNATSDLVSGKSILTEIIINAPSSKVWNVLLDFEKYAEWNPFIRITGKAEVGSFLENTIFLEGQKPQVFKPKVLEVSPEKEFRWKGKLFVKGIFDGEHFFLLETISDRKTRLIHGENFSGLLGNMIFKMIGEKTRHGFEKMNAALKDRCEQLLTKL